jgi:hypothetical protein
VSGRVAAVMRVIVVEMRSSAIFISMVAVRGICIVLEDISPPALKTLTVIMLLFSVVACTVPSRLKSQSLFELFS